MKTSHASVLVAAALIAGFGVARWCIAQSTQPESSKAPLSYDFGALQDLTSFVDYLKDTGQTNTLQRFKDYLTAAHASQQNADLGVTLAILQRLRDGHTNQAYELLENRLDSYIIGFVESYRELPVTVRDQPGLKLLEQARVYRARFPFKNAYPRVDNSVVDAFKILDEKK